MSEWCDSQKKKRINFRNLPQEQIEKTSLRRKLDSEEAQCLNKLEVNIFVFFIKKISLKIKRKIYHQINRTLVVHPKKT